MTDRVIRTNISRRELALLPFLATCPSNTVAEVLQQLRRISIMMAAEEADSLGKVRLQALIEALGELGWVEARDLQLDIFWSGGDVDRIRDYTARLVAKPPDLIVAHGTPVLAALKRATSSIPIIFAEVNDPVAQGFVTNVAHPGGNITGFSFLDYSTVAKSLELLKQIAPRTDKAGVIFNPETYPYYETFLRWFEVSGKALSVEIFGIRVRTSHEIENAIDRVSTETGIGLVVPPDPFTFVHRSDILRTTALLSVPCIYFFRNCVEEGGLISYGANSVEMFRRAAQYIDRVLKGVKPGDLPVQGPIKFELAVNLRTAKALGLNIPDSLLATADKVID